MVDKQAKKPVLEEKHSDDDRYDEDISDLPRPTIIRRPKTPDTGDPVQTAKKKEKEKEIKTKPCTPPCVCNKESVVSTKIEPTISHRLGFKYVYEAPTGEARRVYVSPLKRKEEYFNKPLTNRYHCKYASALMPRPISKRKLEINLAVPSPEPSSAKVALRRATPSPSLEPFSPERPDEEGLEIKKPKSGIFINVKESDKQKPGKVEDYDSFDLVYQRQPRPRSPDYVKERKQKMRERSGLADITEDDETRTPVSKKRKKRSKRIRKKSVTDDELDMDGFASDNYYDGEGEESGAYLTRMFRRKVSLTSAATSYQSRDIPHSTISLVTDAGVDKYIQKFRRDSEMKKFQPKKRKIKRGTLQSHSFTDMYQPILKDFFFGSMQGTMHQGDLSFPESIRNKQGLCMPVAAYCYSMILHPNKWTTETIDKILSYGNQLFMDSIEKNIFYNTDKEFKREDLIKYCIIGCNKMRFSVEDPDITGYIRSDDKRVYNLTKALKIFFYRQTAGIFKTQDISIAIWKNKYLYMFDARPRTKDLYVCCAGTAIMANFYDVTSLATVLLGRSNFANWSFAIYPLKVFKVMHIYDFEEESTVVLDVKSEYNILNENKAVVLASFDLADKYFEFSRNLQSLPMSVIALVYSRITHPSVWHRRTLDKILILGNLLYKECVECKNVLELKLENLPALFTIGPYIVEIYIFGNVFADLMYRSCVCPLKKCFEQFFGKCTNAILQIGTCHMAIWKQRNMLYCFDPYSRNSEGYAQARGVACVSMHSTLDSLIDLIATNYDKDAVFYIHALKVCKIHRDPCQAGRFPRHLSMDDFPVDTFKKYKIKKSKKNATEKPITVDYSAIAMRRLLMEESPRGSIVEIGSTVGSIAMDQLGLPPYQKRVPSLILKPAFKKKAMEEVIADLDSPSLEDTQIEPPLPQQTSEEIEFMDLDDFEMTMEEKEMEEPPAEGEDGSAGKRFAHEGEDESERKKAQLEKELLEEPEEWYYATDKSLQKDMTLEPSRVSMEINTELTYFPIKKEILYPTYIRGKQQMKYRLQKYKFTEEDWENYLPPSPPDLTQSEELKKDTNFIDLPDDTQIILGSKNVAHLGKTVEYIAPFVCIMANVVAKKYSIISWTGEIVDYILRCGNELYSASKFRYDQVSKLEIPRITLGNNAYSVLVEYIFDSYIRQNILALALDKILFVRSDTGVLVTPSYACAVMHKNYLYYLFDPFGNNEVGLSEGPSQKGVTCCARFKDLHSLTMRILYNKKKRESAEEVAYSRFVLSSVKVKEIINFAERGKPKKKKDKRKTVSSDEEGEGQISEYYVEEAEEEMEKEEKEEFPENKVGYHYQAGHCTILGTKALPNRKAVSADLKEDHFICVCACLLLLTTPVTRWDTRKVDLAIDYGVHVYSHADDLLISEKRTIKNILVGKHFFDIIIKLIKIEDWKQNRNLSKGIDYLLAKKLSYFMVQFANASYVIHKTQDEKFHIFDPYGQPKNQPAGWLKCRDIRELKWQLKKKILRDAKSYNFYTFEVTSITKAPKDLVISHELQTYDMITEARKEKQNVPFYEDVEWLKVDPIAWSRKNVQAPNGKTRGTPENLWHNWDEEYPKDLYSLMGNVNELSTRFSSKTRAKQTLANLVTAIGMTKIYELEEWNAAVVDSVLVNGDNYFRECMDNISEEDYELTIDDLNADCSIFPFSFKVTFNPIVEGTMFLVRPTQYNLYKALWYFFNNFTNRCGIIFVTRQQSKRQVSFGKLRESEYFMFDSSCRGSPMFLQGTGVAYILRMTTLNRLLHVLTLTLRGGDFYIYEVEVADLKPIN
uniref:Uncharacterized protein LOC114333566 isoform X1 n=2 Tax=Diabrotica virgifera virgifera TaxID=50390 RepID=A0A6P7G2I3_DIAVI